MNIAYHDAEWGVPVHDDRLLFEFLILEGAQAGEGVRTHPVSRNQEIRGLFFDYRRLKRIVYHLFVELYSEI